MSKFVLCLPYIYKPYFDECLKTIGQLPETEILPIDNTEDNRGVAESWNLGIDRLRENNADWLIVMSAAMRFGEPGGLDMIQQIEKHPLAKIIHFGTIDVMEQGFYRGTGPSYPENLGWHLTAISKEIINAVGYFDPNFYPSYFEDIDYDLRINKAYKNSPLNKYTWPILPVNVTTKGLRHAVELAGVKTPINELIAYFATKWGTHPAATRLLGSYDWPFGGQQTIKFFPPNKGRVWQWRTT